MELLASGREADVYAIDADRVLRRYRTGADAAPEAVVMAHVAAHGVPVPAVYSAAGPDLVMERLSGPTLATGGTDVATAAGILADLHHRLRAVPGRVLHLDLHPENVVLTARGPVLIDWHNATAGDPDLDPAVTAIILAQVAVDDGHEWAAPARELLTAFLDRVGGDPVRALPGAVARRAADPALTAREVGLLDQAARLVRSTR